MALAAYFLLTMKKGISGPELARRIDVSEEIHPGATIKTDGWRGDRNLTGYHNIPRKQRKGKEGRDLPALHLLFANFKRIIRGVHVHVSSPKLQRYLDLFEYRYNHRDNLSDGFYNAAIHLTAMPPRSYQQLKSAATAL